MSFRKINRDQIDISGNKFPGRACVKSNSRVGKGPKSNTNFLSYARSLVFLISERDNEKFDFVGPERRTWNDSSYNTEERDKTSSTCRMRDL